MKIIPKEISWLSFNTRVLQEAENPDVPLLERIKFLGIYSSNLDEFFRVRVATLRRLAPLGKKGKKIIGYDPKVVLKQVHDTVVKLGLHFDDVYRNILDELARENIFIVNERQLTSDQGEFVTAYFQRQVRPKLIPVMVDHINKIPELQDQSIYFAIILTPRKKSGRPMRAIMQVPSNVLPRFITLPSPDQRRFVILLDDVIRYNLASIFSVFDIEQAHAYTIKITRDAELDIADDFSESYIKKVTHSLKQRKEGEPVRFVYDADIPKPLFDYLIRKLHLSRDDTLIPGGRYHNFKDFIKFPDFGLDHWKYPARVSLPHREIIKNPSLFTTIGKKDLLLHYPYHSFDNVIDLLREASIDPKVTAIKITLYRVARESSVINALINALNNGKSVTVILELQARFDEEANIYWANKLQEEGIRVIYGVPGLKVHAKLCLISRRQRGGLLHYAIIGTGNFNEDTARTYSDHALFTADPRLTSEVVRVFDFFESNYRLSTFKHLIVSPFYMRRKILRLIQDEPHFLQAGKPAWIFMKLNNLADPEVIQYLYQAGRCGVQIRLMVRGMFSLIPGVPGLSENIEGRALVDRYLEHSRIFIFAHGGNPRFFITSADLMTRNIDRRVEVTCPIYDKTLQEELLNFMEIHWSDNTKARRLDEASDNAYISDLSVQSIRAQWEVYEYLKRLNEPDGSPASESMPE